MKYALKPYITSVCDGVCGAEKLVGAATKSLCSPLRVLWQLIHTAPVPAPAMFACPLANDAIVS